MRLTLMHKANLSTQYWFYAFQTVVYLINRVPYVVLGFKSSFKSLYVQSSHSIWMLMPSIHSSIQQAYIRDEVYSLCPTRIHKPTQWLHFPRHPSLKIVHPKTCYLQWELIFILVDSAFHMSFTKQLWDDICATSNLKHNHCRYIESNHSVTHHTRH